mmetsp:Transcript_11109/g.11199  ORF Transcript_11109/g.11199 Transcript_11109/m.11199 type:complete len:127 (-) Transcript_11109:112-492(-)
MNTTNGMKKVELKIPSIEINYKNMQKKCPEKASQYNNILLNQKEKLKVPRKNISENQQFNYVSYKSYIPMEVRMTSQASYLQTPPEPKKKKVKRRKNHVWKETMGEGFRYNMEPEIQGTKPEQNSP